jgi:hypothetical protein
MLSPTLHSFRGALRSLLQMPVAMTNFRYGIEGPNHAFFVRLADGIQATIRPQDNRDCTYTYVDHHGPATGILHLRGINGILQISRGWIYEKVPGKIDGMFVPLWTRCRCGQKPGFLFHKLGIRTGQRRVSVLQEKTNDKNRVIGSEMTPLAL